MIADLNGAALLLDKQFTDGEAQTKRDVEPLPTPATIQFDESRCALYGHKAVLLGNALRGLLH